MTLALLTHSLLGCAGGGATDPVPTLDVKVDQNNTKEAPVESVVPRACASGGRVYAVWQNDEDGASSVWVNASGDGGATWMPGDIRLNTADAAATNPDIACSGQNVYVVWEDERDGDLRYRNVYVSVSNDGGRTWLEEDVLLDGDPEGEAMSLGPRVVAVGDAAYVTWFDNRDGAYDIYVQATQDAGETWLDAPSRVDTDTAGEAYSAWPRIVGDTSGRVVVAWEDSRSGSSDIYVNVSTDGGASFSEEDTRLDGGEDAGASNSFLPSLAMAQDHVYVVWHDERNGENRDVFLNASGDGGETWLEEAKRADSDAKGQADSINPVVAAVNDRVHLAWQDDRAGGYDVFHRFSKDGGESWAGDEVRMDTDAGGESQSYDPVLAVDGETVLVGWEDRRADAEHVGFDDLYYNWSSDGGKTFAAEDLRINSNEPGTAYSVDLSIVFGGDGLVAVWADGRFGTSDIFAANRVLGQASVYVAPEEDTGTEGGGG